MDRETPPRRLAPGPGQWQSCQPRRSLETACAPTQGGSWLEARGSHSVNQSLSRPAARHEVGPTDRVRYIRARKLAKKREYGRTRKHGFFFFCVRIFRQRGRSSSSRFFPLSSPPFSGYVLPFRVRVYVSSLLALMLVVGHERTCESVRANIFTLARNLVPASS